MGKSVDNPKKFIISCRVDNDELQTLQEKAKAAGTNISAMLRLSLNLLDQDASVASPFSG
jgi:hypothetical protein